MTCKRCKKLFSAYLDGDLDIGDSSRFHNHLAECEQCAAEFAGFKKVVALTTDLPQIQPSPDFDRNLRARLSHVEENRRFIMPFGSRAMAAISIFCILLVSVFGTYMYKFRSDGHQMRSDDGMQILTSKENGAMLRSHTDENILTNFIMPTVSAVDARRSELGDIVMTEPENWQETRNFVLPFVRDENSEQDKPEMDYIIKRISFISTSDETGL